MRKIKFRAWTNNPTPHTRNFDEIILEQFTGLKDKNGQEIYEGDILSGWVHDKNKPFIVKFLNSDFTCGFVAESVNKNSYIEVWYKGLTVIGNIHENQELLEANYI